MPVRITLTKEQYERLKALDADIQFAREEIARAKRVGIDISELEKYLEDVVKLRDNLMREYKPEGVD